MGTSVVQYTVASETPVTRRFYLDHKQIYLVLDLMASHLKIPIISCLQKKKTL